MSERVGCVTIDLDGIACYSRIHALALPPRTGADPLHTVALERFGELLAEAGISGTAFAIGESLQEPLARKALRGLADAGHEIGNHSLSHDYRLSLRSPEIIAREVEAGVAAIEEAVGVRPEGFRAPGYNLSPALLQAIADSGARYDSSIFPSAPYLLARAAILGVMALAGRPSASHAGNTLTLLAPQRPYRPHLRDVWRRGRAAPLVELPITVTPLTGLPFIGTTIVGLPFAVTRESFRLLRRRAFLNLELHGIDLLDPSDGLPVELARRQRELAVPAKEKLRRLREVLRWLVADRPLTTLAQVARSHSMP